MTPPVHSFPASDLPLQVQIDEKGRIRKTEDGRPIDLLTGCELLGLVQYHCSVDHPEIRNSPVRCWPIQRWFRRCQDKRGSFTVETTAWEGSALASTTPPPQQRKTVQVDHWTPSGQDGKSIPRYEM